MKKLIRMGVAALLAGVLTMPAQAQEIQNRSAVEAELRAMAAAPTSADRDRAEVRRFLQNDRVRSVAAEMSVDIEELEAGVSTLDGEELAGVAERIRQSQDETPLAGGDTFVVTSTTIIIALLIIILIIVA